MELCGASFDTGTCKLAIEHTQTVPVPEIGFYELELRARASSGSMGLERVRGLPQAEAQYTTITSPDWYQVVLPISAIQGATRFWVELGRVLNDDVEFHDISLRLISHAAH